MKNMAAHLKNNKTLLLQACCHSLQAEVLCKASWNLTAKIFYVFSSTSSQTTETLSHAVVGERLNDSSQSFTGVVQDIVTGEDPPGLGGQFPHFYFPALTGRTQCRQEVRLLKVLKSARGAAWWRLNWIREREHTWHMTHDCYHTKKTNQP